MANEKPDPELLEDFGPYKLVARFVNGAHHGVLWRSGKKLVELTASSNTQAKEFVLARFYELRMEQVGKRGDEAPGDQETMQALMYIWPFLNSGQINMLQAQYRAKDRMMSTTELARVAPYKSHHPVNLYYGQAGFMLFNELPRSLPTNKYTGEPIYSFALSTGPLDQDIERKNWVWQMREEVARGLSLADLVSN